MEPEKLCFELTTDKWDLKIPKNSPQNYEVEADFYKWTERLVVMIIVWKWWTTQWYQNKYETIAKNLVKNHGANVFVIENPWISRDNPELFFDSAMKFVKKKVKDYRFRKHTIYAVWFSAWWHFVWRFAYKYPGIKQILLINPVLRVDFEKLKKSLNMFKWKITIIQWDKDTDYPFNPLLIQVRRAHVKVIEWVNHQFSNEGWLETFIELPEKYLFGKVLMKCRFCGSECDWNEDVCSSCFSSIHEHYIPNEARFPREDIEKCINGDNTSKKHKRGIYSLMEKNIKKYTNKNNYTESKEKCPICGKNMIHIYFKSPSDTWKLMCGRAGDLDVCTECQRWFNFRCHIMN